MLRPCIAATALALCATGLVATPATASEVLYGFAWSDGPGTLRITPAKATPVKQYGILRYMLKPVAGARERRLDYSGADFRRLTAACDLKETEGVVKLDAKGLGRTRCKDSDLAFVLKLGPSPVRISLGAKTTRIQEFLPTPSDPKTAFGTIRRVNDTTVAFTRGGRTVQLGYTALSFSRATRACGDSWLANHAKAGRDGLGTKACDTAAFTKVLKAAKHPVLAKVDYHAASGHLFQVWEVFGDA